MGRRRRLAAARLPDQERDSSQGVRLATMKGLVRYWQTDYDWRKAESCSSRQRGQCWTLGVVIECFGHLATTFASPHSAHQVMQRPNVLVPQRVSQPGLMSTLFHGGDVYVVRGIEILGLGSQFRLHVVKREFLSAGQP